MKNEKLQDAIGMIGDDLIERAKNDKKPSRVQRWLVVAACLAVVMLVSVKKGDLYFNYLLSETDVL